MESKGDVEPGGTGCWSIAVPPLWDLGDLPPIGGIVDKDAHPFLARVLWLLLTAAKRNILPPLVDTLDPPGIANEMEALEAAASRIHLNGLNLLSDRLWRHPDAIRRGDLGRAINPAEKGNLPWFVLVYADEVRGGLIMGKGMSPVRVELSDIPVAGEAVGPYLVLIVCRLEGSGRARAVSAFAQPVLAGQCFVPVWSELERDVLRAIGHLRLRLDAFGIDCTVERVMPAKGGDEAETKDIVITTREQGGRELSLAIRIVASAGLEERRCDGLPEHVFLLDQAGWQSGSLVRWLEETLIGDCD